MTAQPPSERKTYLGDGAYAELRDGELILTAENGITATDRIVLGDAEYRALLAFVDRLTDMQISNGLKSKRGQFT